MKLKNIIVLFFLLLECVSIIKVESKCVKGCDLALASYHVRYKILPKNITDFLHSNILYNSDIIISYNKDKLSNRDNLPAFKSINIPFPCDCIEGEFLGHVFEYSTSKGDTYDLIANRYYASLTTVDLLKKFNSYDPNHNLPSNAKVNVTVNCSCGNSLVSKDYGLFVTYPLSSMDTLQSIANTTNLDATLLQSYNQGVNFSKGSGIVFIPGKDQNGDYPPLFHRAAGLAKGPAFGISIAGICGLLLLVICIYVKYFQKNEREKDKLPKSFMALSNQDASGSAEYETSGSSGTGSASASGLTSIMIAKSTEFTYQEIAKATNNFSLDNKIGQGGFS